MQTLVQFYIILSTILMGILGVIWSKNGIGNLIIKIIMVFLSFLGIIIELKYQGII